MLHFSLQLFAEGFRPLSPNYQHIGMMNCRSPMESIPGDISSFLEEGGGEGGEGVVVVSFGSVLKASEMTEEIRSMFFRFRF